MTRIKLIIVGLLIAILTTALYLGYPHMLLPQPKTKFQKSELVPGSIQLFSTTDSALFQLPKADRILLVYFNSDCHYCQKEFTEMEETADRFSDIEVIFFSIEPIQQIRAFVEGYELAGHKNFHFTKINPAHQADVFGLLTAPSFFFYKHNKLVNEFKGKKSVEELLKPFK
jgi:thiol-disulfide isomerase/thioredoxin